MTRFRDYAERHGLDARGDEAKIGDRVVPTASLKSLERRADGHEGELAEAVRSFRRDGGKVIGRDGRRVLVESSAGAFFLPPEMIALA